MVESLPGGLQEVAHFGFILHRNLDSAQRALLITLYDNGLGDGPPFSFARVLPSDITLTDMLTATCRATLCAVEPHRVLGNAGRGPRKLLPDDCWKVDHGQCLWVTIWRRWAEDEPDPFAIDEVTLLQIPPLREEGLVAPSVEFLAEFTVLFCQAFLDSFLLSFSSDRVETNPVAPLSATT